MHVWNLDATFVFSFLIRFFSLSFFLFTSRLSRGVSLHFFFWYQLIEYCSSLFQLASITVTCKDTLCWVICVFFFFFLVFIFLFSSFVYSFFLIFFPCSPPCCADIPKLFVYPIASTSFLCFFIGDSNTTEGVIYIQMKQILQIRCGILEHVYLWPSRYVYVFLA